MIFAAIFKSNYWYMALRDFFVLTVILCILAVQSSGDRLSFDDGIESNDEDGYHLKSRRFFHKHSPALSHQIPNTLGSLIYPLSNKSAFDKSVQENQQNADSSLPSASDPCNANPCENEGSCIPTGEKSYECKCIGPWRGTHCTIPDACYNSPCENGGICLNVHDNYWCQCPDEYYGVNCQKKYSDAKYPKKNCRPNVCHTGVCISFNNGYYCQCPRDRHGDHCEKRISKRQASSFQYYRDLLKQLRANPPKYVETNRVNGDNSDEVAIYDAANGVFF